MLHLKIFSKLLIIESVNFQIYKPRGYIVFYLGSVCFNIVLLVVIFLSFLHTFSHILHGVLYTSREILGPLCSEETVVSCS